MSAVEKIGIGIVGSGMGSNHARNFKKMPNVRLVGIGGPDVERCQRVADANGIPHVYADYHELFARPDVDAVTIAVPNMYHKDVVLAALAAGKHVLVEKPLAHTSADGEEIVRVAERSNRVVMIGFNNRFTGAAQALRQALAAGRLGEVYYGRTRWLRRQGIPGFGGWFTTKAQSGGGPLIDIGVHMLDLALYLMNYPQPVSVFGSTYAKFGPHGKGAWRGWVVSDAAPSGAYDVEDLATGMIKFANGATLLVEASWASYIAKADDMGLELLGDVGGARLTYEETNPLTIFTELDGQQVDIIPETPHLDSHAEEMRLFVEAIINGTPPPATVQEGLTVLKIIEALYASAQQGEAVLIKPMAR